MFGFKYIAINELTNIEVKRFRTLRGAKRWYKKPMKLMGLKISKSSLFIGIHNINDLEVVTQESLVQESLNAFELMREYAKWDAEATTQISPEGMDRFESEIEEFDERCEDTSCLYCYGTQEEYERGAFDSEIPIAVGEEQDALPGLEQPMPAWEHELLYALTSKNCGDENCEICAAEAAAQEKREHKIDKNGKCSDCEYTSNDALQELVAEAQQAAEQEATVQETLFSKPAEEESERIEIICDENCENCRVSMQQTAENAKREEEAQRKSDEALATLRQKLSGIDPRY